MVSAGDYATAAAMAGRMPVGSGESAIDLAGIARVMSAYQDVKSQAGAIDFEDVLLLMVALIGDRPDIADVIRSQYRWFTVDEYQDITPAQDRLLSGWLGDRDDVCVVGRREPDHLLVRRGQPRRAGGVRPTLAERHGGAPGPLLPLHAGDRRGGQLRHPQRRGRGAGWGRGAWSAGQRRGSGPGVGRGRG